ncbi:MAG: S8 family peptidase [Flavobacteriales bacterium]|jgi:subtilisin family serine protease
MNIRFLKAGLIALVLGLATTAVAQKKGTEEPKAPVSLQWQHGDAASDNIIGVSSFKAMNELLKDKKPTPIIVAVLDSGTETFHPDLKNNLWVNTDEIPANGIDDDKNGYIDDMHGWSFIGGKDGDVGGDNLEFTRIYKGLKDKFEGKEAASIAKEDKKEYERYLKFKTGYEERVKKAKEEKAQFDQFYSVYQMADGMMKGATGKDEYTVEDLKALQPKDEMTSGFREMMVQVMEAGLTEQLGAWREHVEDQMQYSYNLELDTRQIVGDNYADPRERIYGNNHIDGPKAEHGTHVAGIIGATHNEFGINGISSSAKLMIVRCVPGGDERDKDVANAIRYAVDNGAKIINMSFGKSYSPNKDVVDEAVRYAESKGVLLIHAAGNDSKNIDKNDNFPNKKYLDGKSCTTWLEVGASGSTKEALVAPFSNYGKKSVDVFAPGVDVYSTMTGDSYKKESGTSMAAPVTAGVAAALWSYYPNLTALQVKEILMKSAVPYKKLKVTLPGSETEEKPEGKKIAFGSLSKTGAIVNLYQAMLMAEKMK